MDPLDLILPAAIGGVCLAAGVVLGRTWRLWARLRRIDRLRLARLELRLTRRQLDRRRHDNYLLTAERNHLVKDRDRWRTLARGMAATRETEVAHAVNLLRDGPEPPTLLADWLKAYEDGRAA